MIRIPLATFLLSVTTASIAQLQSSTYWNTDTPLVPWRAPLPADSKKSFTDVDKDGDPDILHFINTDGVKFLWIDDDDDMTTLDIEGDLDSDCLLVDRNNDGRFAGPEDLSIDWNDENGDGKADIQLVVINGSIGTRNFFDWSADYMYVMDLDGDGMLNHVDWNKLTIQAWEHDGHSNFFTDYSGNSLFLKMHGSSFRINDLRYNWENPFIFYDLDNDGLTEMSIRLVDTPKFRPADNSDPEFKKLDGEHDVIFTKRIDHVSLAFDLDNDNGAGNEFDFDFSLNLRGSGFSYADQRHEFKSLRGLPAADHYFFDPRWRQITELYYPDQDSAWNLIFQKGNWQQCTLVFDEDDDCLRWERVEFYEPKDLFLYGKNNGGLDNNPQADAAGDRGEWDKDFSGKGQLYVGAFDGMLHLFGAESGAWRIDQNALSFQGFGGLYNRWHFNRLQDDLDKFATVKYSDTDKNGFLDLFEYDLDGDKVFEERASLRELNIDDKRPLIQTSGGYDTLKNLFLDISTAMWNRAKGAIAAAEKMHLRTGHYSFYKNPKSLHQRYSYGFWLNFYLFHDMRSLARQMKDKALVTRIEKAYFSGDWSLLDY